MSSPRDGFPAAGDGDDDMDSSGGHHPEREVGEDAGDVEAEARLPEADDRLDATRAAVDAGEGGVWSDMIEGEQAVEAVREMVEAEQAVAALAAPISPAGAAPADPEALSSESKLLYSSREGELRAMTTRARNDQAAAKGEFELPEQLVQTKCREIVILRCTEVDKQPAAALFDKLAMEHLIVAEFKSHTLCLAWKPAEKRLAIPEGFVAHSAVQGRSTAERMARTLKAFMEAPISKANMLWETRGNSSSPADADDGDIHTTRDLLFKLANLTSAELEEKLADARIKNASHRRVASGFEKDLLAAERNLKAILKLEKGEHRNQLIYLSDASQPTFPHSFVAERVSGVKGTYWSTEANSMVTVSLEQAVRDLMYMEFSFVFTGPPKKGKTRLARALARHALIALRVFKEDGTQRNPQECYIVVSKTVDNLRSFNPLMDEFVVILLDDMTASDVRNQGTISPDALKSILDIADCGSARGRHHDIAFARMQPRFITTNSTLSEWMPTGISEFDKQAVQRRMIWFQVPDMVLTEAAVQNHAANMQLLKQRARANLEAFRG